MEIIIMKFFAAWLAVLFFCTGMVCLTFLTDKEIFGRIALMTLVIGVLSSSFYIIFHLIT